MFKQEIGNKLKAARETAGLTQDEVAKKINSTFQKVSSFETGRTRVDLETLLKLCKIYNKDINEILGINNRLEIYSVGTIHKIPVIGRVAAGSGCLAQYDPLGYEIATDIKNPEEYIYFKVKGDSMNPNIMDGDLALVHMQPDVESGELAVVVVNGEEGVIKKVVKHDGAVSLVSFNPEYPPRLIMGHELNEFYIFGKVVETKRKY